MVLKKLHFFILIVLLYSGPIISYKIYWITQSVKVVGVFSFSGMGDAGEITRMSYSYIHFPYDKHEIWFKGLGNLHLKDESPIRVRYQKTDPYDARVDSFDGIWADTVIYGGVPLLMIICIFLHRGIFPNKSKIKLTLNRPFCKIIS